MLLKSIGSIIKSLHLTLSLSLITRISVIILGIFCLLRTWFFLVIIILIIVSWNLMHNWSSKNHFLIWLLNSAVSLFLKSRCRRWSVTTLRRIFLRSWRPFYICEIDIKGIVIPSSLLQSISSSKIWSSYLWLCETTTTS